MKIMNRLITALTFWTFVLVAAADSAAAQTQPTIIKDSLMVVAHTFNWYRGNSDVWSWAPSAEFNVNGPIPSGGNLYLEYKVPGSPPAEVDCKNGALAADEWAHVQCAA